MAMSVDIQQATGATPTYTNVTSVVFSRVDDATGTTPVPTPTATGTNFSYVKSFQPNITNADSLSMTDVKVGKVTSESTGKKYWHDTSHASYTQATTAPSATGDDNSTAPTINSATATALPAIGSANVYSAGPHTTTGRKGNYVEICVGVDSTNTDAGTGVSMPTIRWQWTES